jgi:hypothetical protein
MRSLRNGEATQGCAQRPSTIGRAFRVTPRRSVRSVLRFLADATGPDVLLKLGVHFQAKLGCDASPSTLSVGAACRACEALPEHRCCYQPAHSTNCTTSCPT